jgi:hypothetical protein
MATALFPISNLLLPGLNAASAGFVPIRSHPEIETASRTGKEIEMSVFASPQSAQRGRRVAVVTALAAVIAVAVWAIATYAVGSGSRHAAATPTQASVLSTLTPRQRQYVLGISSLTPAQVSAAFGTDPLANEALVPSSLTPAERRYVRAMASMSYSEMAAAFGTGR